MATLIADDHGRDCPHCGGWLEYAITFARAEHPEADEVLTSGPRAGRHFHAFASCDDCGATYEVARETPDARSLEVAAHAAAGC